MRVIAQVDGFTPNVGDTWCKFVTEYHESVVRVVEWTWLGGFIGLFAGWIVFVRIVASIQNSAKRGAAGTWRLYG